MNNRDAAIRVIRVLKQRLPAGRIHGPSRRIEGAWVSRETMGAFDHGIAIVIDSGLDQRWVKRQAVELIKSLRHETSLNQARRGFHIWNGDKVSRRYRDAKWWEDLTAMEPDEMQDSSLDALNTFVRKSGADQFIVLTTIDKLTNSDKRMRFPACKLIVIFPAGEGERDTYKIKEIPYFGAHRADNN